MADREILWRNPKKLKAGEKLKLLRPKGISPVAYSVVCPYAESVEECPLPDYLLSTWKMLRAAYWGGVPEDEYWVLLRLLKERMSHRALADTMAELSSRDWGVIYNDIAIAQSRYEPSGELLENVISKLRRHGYAEWLAEDR